jgi:predicted DNA-binding protein (MmcQ/YjbR family)
MFLFQDVPHKKIKGLIKKSYELIYQSLSNNMQNEIELKRIYNFIITTDK